MEAADEIFSADQVHSGLTADRRVHLCEQRGGDLQHGNAAHENGRQKTRAIAHDSSAKGHQQRLAVGFRAHHPFCQLFHRVQPLGWLTIIHLQDLEGHLGLVQ